ncbi:hypothetical protein MCETHM1_01663 [Flavobacteriaceae bacterium]
MYSLFAYKYLNIEQKKTSQFLEKFCGLSGISVEHLISILTLFNAF